MVTKKEGFTDNAFDLMRLLCALQVVYGHIVEHFDLASINPVFKIILTISQYIPGRGVIVFFAISGFLGVSSVVRNNTQKLYFKKKFLRIYPELWGGYASIPS